MKTMPSHITDVRGSNNRGHLPNMPLERPADITLLHQCFTEEKLKQAGTIYFSSGPVIAAW